MNQTTRYQARTAFTLIELLVVIGIIAALTAILIPVIGMLQGSAEEVKASKQLGELGTALVEYRAIIGKPRSQEFPRNLRYLGGWDWDGEEHRHAELMPLYGEKRAFISPMDPTEGMDPTFNAEPLVGRYGPELHEEGSSFFYEVSSKSAPNDNWWKEGAPQKAIPTDPTWADAKRIQLRYGNMDADGNYGHSFSVDDMPIIRSFWHADWESLYYSIEGVNHTERVLNVAFSTRVFWSIPFWEHQANPDIPLPPK